jgi:lipopolysaccharide biosynthesis regulator YciM
MAKRLRFIGLALLLLVIGFSCSTEKNTFINRNYHSITAHYNGYYNANELIDQSMVTYRDSRLEDYYELLPIDPAPNETEVIGMYPALDTAIAKCKKVIRNHSMPSNDRPSRKKEEHNRWIDENWTTIGIASYYRRDYEGAMKSFNFVRKFYKNDPSLYVGELWMAKTQIAQGKLTEAKFNLDNLDKAIADEEERKEEKSKSKSKKKKKGKDDEIAKVPKDIRFELEKTKAELALVRGEKEDAIGYLETSLEHARMKDDKGRVYFILGQLYQETGQSDKAKAAYTRVIKGKSRYEMRFNARLKRAFLGGGDKVKKELKKLLKDAKNAEYKDQIYFALAEIELKEGNESQGVSYLHRSAFYSTKNTRQKGMAYERLGDLSFSKRKYVPAQKFYDSCATVIDDTYPNAEAIRNKAENLADLVVAVETSQREDSLQMIAAMGEQERENFLKDVIKKIKEEEAARKIAEENRLRELQENENLFDQGGSGGKWYWNNAKARAEGYDDFKRLWGQRENEDDWRRSEKIPEANFDPENPDAPLDSLPAEPEDTLTVEHLLKWIPLTDSAMAISNTKLMEAYYNAGVIYKEQLNEPKLAETQFTSALNKRLQEDPHDLLSSFQLYKLTESSNNTVANQQKDYIMNNYPNSDYANYLRDPEYFIKKKERDALAIQEYVKVLERYERGLYYPVLTKANLVIEQEKDNVFRPKYMLLKAMCQGQLERDKTKLLPVLKALVAEYPETDEAKRGFEMIDIIENGYSENVPIDFTDDSAFKYDDKAKHKVIVFLGPKTSSISAKSRVTDFNREYFSRQRLKVDSKIYGKDQGVVLIEEFDDEMKASAYIRAFKNTRKHLLELKEAKIMMITLDNLKVLFQNANLEEYDAFYEEYY